MKKVGTSSSVNAFKKPLLVDLDSVSILRGFKSPSQGVVVADEVMMCSPAVGSLVGLVWVVRMNIPKGSVDVCCEGWGYAVGSQAFGDGKEVGDMLLNPWVSVSGCVDFGAVCSDVLSIGSWGVAQRAMC